jgi:N6-L-threonylcarbamoyladenine synthase
MALVLGIETSCDETAAAVIDCSKNILSNEIYSQIDAHREYGGVVPEIASRAHIQKIIPVIDKALSNARKSLDEIDVISATAGPGLIGGVIVGLMAAKSLAAVNNKPLICVNHLEGHALTCRLTDNVEFPFLLLLVSGGHCQFILCEELGKYEIIGQTIDDAIGESFDKVAKMLGLSYPGGPQVEQLAKDGDENGFEFPRPLISQDNCNFSLSGLKTAVLREIEKEGSNISQQFAADICASFQKTVNEIILNRTENAIKIAKQRLPNIKNFVLSGGVAANKYIGGNLKNLIQQNELNYYSPPLKLCTDNAVMIAWAGLERFKAGQSDGFNFIPRARWSLEEVV